VTKPLGVVLTREKIDASQVSPRSGEACDKAKLDRVFADAEHDGDLRCAALAT